MPAEGGLGTDGLSAEVAAGPLSDFKWRADLLLPAASAAELEPVSPDDAAVLERWESQLAAAAARKAAREAAAAEAAASPPPAVAGLPPPGTMPGLAQGSGSGSSGARHGAASSPAALQVASQAPPDSDGAAGGFTCPAQAVRGSVGATKRVRARAAGRARLSLPPAELIKLS